MSPVRAGLTQTINQYPHMPATIEALPSLAPHLDELRAANVAHHCALVAEAKRRGVRVLCLGELFPAPYFALRRQEMWRELAEDAQDGPSVRAMRACAAAQGVIVVAPIYELDRGSGRRFNTAVVIDERGAVLGKYRKTHIPEGRNEQAAFCETFYYEASDGRMNAATDAVVSRNPFFPVFQTSAGRLGIAICYDRHFEGVVAALVAGGAEVVLSPAVTFGAKSRRLWPLEFQVDAARHRVFIGGGNRQGKEPPWNQEYFGESLFCGPDGVLPNLRDHAELVVADLELATLRGGDDSGWDLRRDRRPSIYDAC